MERLSIASFLKHGHAFHLYSYGELENVPEGAAVMDGAQILPRSAIFRYRESGSYAGFANFFRYKLLLEKGGWWVDLDTVCLRPFDFPQDYVFASELDRGTTYVGNAVIRVPANSGFARHCCQVCQSKKSAELRWGETGPRLAKEAVETLGLQESVRPPETFCPVPYREWMRVLDPAIKLVFGESSYAIHLWQEMWRRNNKDKDARYHPGCLYEKLRANYLDR